ncbi:hypothetical protein [Leptolyngbya sp. FACHB-261]|uniref:hypothetical protein n=1 Tax=Leptolyngbya sp. FACHB-261 TaxID=2692806 RepID=UPI001688F59F|nr:hypothetical protein [Leptolyngbya sp. FACHB-261]MBD2103799.1 hypothetical protein [Leptolyngbya sp. FACHB-261]
MSTATRYPTAPDLTGTEYLVLGLATCFTKQDGEVQKVRVVEPIPSAALEAVLKGIPTSYELVYATTLGEVLEAQTVRLNPDVFPEDVNPCPEFAFRALSAARTYRARPAAQQHVSLGTTRKEGLNFSLDRKRVLNSERVVTTEDNIKQHPNTHKVL